ncbi:hypothetical protein O181_103774 [Austropuccinia psidii MF-1]|uniref:Uncharacterized protein n=1 Tax=Austropuccinia psidii MF-1 TaxID=1389203 RepID=A0A9Q3JL45_9BASI|nr:hypothetical protein [Austropuccinia psidii MF-1]
MELLTKDPKVSDAIEAIPCYEEGNLTKIKKDLIAKGGRGQPEKRYRKDSRMDISNDTQDNGGIDSLSQYKEFMGDYEIIATHSLRYRYIPQDSMHHEDLFYCLSAEFKGVLCKEMIKDNVIVSFEDGGYLIPPMKILKRYIEQELEARILVIKRYGKKFY